jgi:hypothetical protein
MFDQIKTLLQQKRRLGPDLRWIVRRLSGFVGP